MTTDIRVVHAQDFVRVTSTGSLDFEASKNILSELAEATGSLADFQILIDARTAQTRMSSGDLWLLALEFSKSRNSLSQKTAVLCRADRSGDGEFFARSSAHRGFKVRSFTSFEDAINWLFNMASDT
jgi:hypothetical protein